jgi:hypothetical protein
VAVVVDHTAVVDTAKHAEVDCGKRLAEMPAVFF